MWRVSQISQALRPGASGLSGEYAPGKGDARRLCASLWRLPLDDERLGEMVYIDMLNQAREYVHIMTPYLILDEEMKRALMMAARRGVEVVLILPHIPDKPYAFALAKAHYRQLLEAGVQIYEFTPGFVHAKEFVSDGKRAVVGTINLDYRSSIITLNARPICGERTVSPDPRRF